MWNGWMSFAGNEVINTARTEAYAANAGVGWFRPCESCPDLNIGLGDDPYLSPLLDLPGWYDKDDPDTWNFYGFYPLDITGTDDSVRTASITQGLGAGGIVGPIRQQTRSIVVNGMLIGLDECAVSAGMSWLRWVLIGSNCREEPFCSGDELCFLSCCPDFDPCLPVDPPEDNTLTENPAYPDGCFSDFLRRYEMATVTEGPTVSAKHTMSDGGAAWEVQFTITCAVPWTYGAAQLVFDGQDFPGHSVIDNADTQCPTDSPGDIQDPNCPKVAVTPTVPKVDLTCFDIPAQWDRYVFPINQQFIRVWTDSVPIIQIRTVKTGNGVRNLRFRFYADPLSRGKMGAVDPCDFCGEFLISYIPPGARMVLSGLNETIMVHTTTAKGKPTVLNGSSLVMDTDGGPFDWPLITCGYAYIMVVDISHGDEAPDWLTLSMVPRGI